MLQGVGWKRLGQWALRAIGPVLLLVLLLRVVDYAELRDVVGGIRLPWALAALAVVQLNILLRTFRWIEIHGAVGLPRAPLTYQLRLSYATSLATFVLPQILNPFSRLILLLQDGFRVRRAAAGAVIEKAFELATFVVFGLYGSIFLASTFGSLVWWAVGVAFVAVAFGVGVYLGRSRLGRLATTLLAKIPGIGDSAAGSEEDVVRDVMALGGPVLARLFVWSLVIALTQTATLYLLSRSLGVGLSYPFIVAVWGIVALSMLLPISINGIGTREAIFVVAFRAADKSTDAAVALGLLVVAAVAVGSSPGAVEWLRRFLTGSGEATVSEASGTASMAPPAVVRSQGERGR